MLVAPVTSPVCVALVDGDVAQVNPPVFPDCAVNTKPLVGVLLIFKLASSTTLSAITVAPSAVEVTSPE